VLIHSVVMEAVMEIKQKQIVQKIVHHQEIVQIVNSIGLLMAANAVILLGVSMV